MDSNHLTPMQVRTYSEIRDLQCQHTVSYFCRNDKENIILSVEDFRTDGKISETCICRNITREIAQDIMRLAAENSVGIGCWLDLLTDNGIDYELIEE